MPVCVKELYRILSIYSFESVRWEINVECDSQGVYMVAISEDAEKCVNPYEKAPINTARIAEWISRVPDMRIDGNLPTIETLSQRLSEFWIPDETILYIGKSKKLGERLKQFYRHKLGNKAPHKGGVWLKTLDVLDDLHIYYAPTDEHDMTPEHIEQALLRQFMKRVSQNSRSIGRIGLTKGTDELFPIPFANRYVDFSGRHVKDHGISNDHLSAPK